MHVRLLLCLFAVALARPAVAQMVAPPEVVRSAVESVEDLGRKIVMGEHRVAVDRMYPKWKARLAKRSGGIDKLEAKLLSSGDVLARYGMSIISVKALGVPKSYEVWPGKNSAGEVVMTKWLVLVPTVTRLRVLQEGTAKAYHIDNYGYQVAIADKGTADWTFINGSDVEVADLRSLFTSLPANIELPAVKQELVE